MKLFLIFLIMLTEANLYASNRVRYIEVQNDQIVKVQVSLGIATIIQVPDRPSNIVVGDQGSFKIEYLDQAITIKPLRLGAKSNLYIYTDWKRYNIELISGPENVADYLVYLKTPSRKLIKSNPDKGVKVRWISLEKEIQNGSFTLKLKRLGKTTTNVYLVEFELRSYQKEKFKPEWIWLTQKTVTKPIQGLVLSSVDITPNLAASGLLSFKRSDLNQKLPITIEIRRKKTTSLNLTFKDWK